MKMTTLQTTAPNNIFGEFGLFNTFSYPTISALTERMFKEKIKSKTNFNGKIIVINILKFFKLKLTIILES